MSYGILTTSPRQISKLERVQCTLINPQDLHSNNFLKCLYNKGHKSDRAKIIEMKEKKEISESH